MGHLVVPCPDFPEELCQRSQGTRLDTKALTLHSCPGYWLVFNVVFTQSRAVVLKPGGRDPWVGVNPFTQEA